MDEDNYRAVSSLCRGSAVVRPFLDFATDSPKSEVPDPYYGSPDGFEHVLDLVEDASEGLLADIRAGYLRIEVATAVRTRAFALVLFVPF